MKGENSITLTEQLHHGMNCSGLIPGNEDDCTCGLYWRIALQTEQNCHAAWVKRATEAEATLVTLKQDNDALRSSDLALRTQIKSSQRNDCITGRSNSLAK